jgi:hypothetical membrane protein
MPIRRLIRLVFSFHDTQYHSVQHDIRLVSFSSLLPHVLVSSKKTLLSNLGPLRVRRRFMLFAGRLADLFPAQWLFEGGLFLLGVLMLVLSFSACHSRGEEG